MSYWNYRVIRTENKSGEVLFNIHEVYYTQDGTIETWTENPVLPQGESVGELREDIHYFLNAFTKPILEEDEDQGKPILKPVYDEEDSINREHYFELMDRAWVALNYCNNSVGDHPLIRKNKELKNLFEKVSEDLFNLYQAAAELEFGHSEDS